MFLFCNSAPERAVSTVEVVAVTSENEPEHAYSAVVRELKSEIEPLVCCELKVVLRGVELLNTLFTAGA